MLKIFANYPVAVSTSVVFEKVPNQPICLKTMAFRFFMLGWVG